MKRPPFPGGKQAKRQAPRHPGSSRLVIPPVPGPPSASSTHPPGKKWREHHPATGSPRVPGKLPGLVIRKIPYPFCHPGRAGWGDPSFPLQSRKGPGKNGRAFKNNRAFSCSASRHHSSSPRPGITKSFLRPHFQRARSIFFYLLRHLYRVCSTCHTLSLPDKLLHTGE